jgi:hypothetical protein
VTQRTCKNTECGASISRHSKTGECVRCSRATQARERSATKTAGESGDSVSVNGDSCVIARSTTEKVRTLADLIRVCDIDTAEWEIVEWSCKASQQASVPRAVRPATDKKWTRPSTEPVLTQMFHVSAKLRRKSRAVLTLEALRTGLVADIRAEVKRGRAIAPSRRYVNGDWLFEFSPFDLHMGKYTWNEETVTNYDTDMAADLFDASLDFLLARAMKLTDGRLSRVLCVFGNDVSHIDSKRGQTTAGTPMDVDTRYIRVYRRICEVHRRAVDRLRDVAPVDIKIVSGNHDELTSFHLGEILATRYDGVRHVTVDNSPRQRKYYEFGTNLFGFTHGDSEKVSELPLVMAREIPEQWARCASREWHIGHKHIAEKFAWRSEQDLFSDKGVRVRRLASLSAHDAWHTKHAYMDRRACDGFVFHRDAGFTDHLSFNVDHFTGKALKTA